MQFDFQNNFSQSIKNFDFDNANKCLMQELANILMKNKADFVEMLNQSGIIANVNMTDAQLITLFISNIKTNKKLILGASLLANVYNKKMGFDGQFELSDSDVKCSYQVLNSYFNDEFDLYEFSEQQSDFLGAGLLLKGAKKLIEKRKDKKSNNEAVAKQQMLERAKQLREEAERKRKKQNTQYLIIGGSVLVLSLVAVIIYKSRK